MREQQDCDKDKRSVATSSKKYRELSQRDQMGHLSHSEIIFAVVHDPCIFNLE